MAHTQQETNLPYFMSVDVVRDRPSQDSSTTWNNTVGVSAYPVVSGRVISPTILGNGYTRCPVCNKEVSQPKIHAIEHSKTPDGYYHCVLCDVKSRLLGELTRHMDAHRKADREEQKKAAAANPQPAAPSPKKRVRKVPEPRQEPKEKPTFTYVSSTNMASPALASSLRPIQDPAEGTSSDKPTLPSIRSFAWYNDAPPDNRRQQPYNAPLPPIQTLGQRQQ